MGKILGIGTLLIFIFGMIAGWIMNIVWLIKQDLTWTVEQGLSVVGIFIAPLGALLGWIH